MFRQKRFHHVFTISYSDASSETSNTSKMELFCGIYLPKIFRIKLHLRFLTGFWIRLCSSFLEWFDFSEFIEPVSSEDLFSQMDTTNRFLCVEYCEFGKYISQPVFTCSKSTLETQEQCVKSV